MEAHRELIHVGVKGVGPTTKVKLVLNRNRKGGVV